MKSMRLAFKRGGLGAATALGLLICVVSLCGCAAKNTATAVANANPSTPYGVASKVSYDIAAVTGQASATLDSFRLNGSITAAEDKAGQQWLLAVNTANSSYLSCVVAAHGASGTAAGFIACAQSFATDAQSAQTLQGIRIVNQSAQQTVSGWAQLISQDITSATTTLNALKSNGQ